MISIKEFKKIYSKLLNIRAIFFVTLDKEMIEAINLSIYESNDVLKLLLSDIPLEWWRLITLQGVTHILDVLLVTIYDAAFLAGLFVFWKD